MIPLKELRQLSVGTKIKLVAKCEEDSYNEITVKKIIPMKNQHGDNSLLSAGPNDTEILLCKENNVYFSMNKYLKGNSWVNKIYIYEEL